MAGTDEDKKDATEETATAPEEAEEKDADKKDNDEKKNTDEQSPTEVSAETLSNVAERLKFFFSDANIRVDRFMQNQINVRQGSGKRPVPIEVLLRFNTLKKYTTDASVVIQAAKQLLSEQLVVVVNNDNNEKDSALQRVHSFTMEMMNDNIPKTLVVSNLPITKTKKKEAEKEEEDEEEATYAISMDDIRKVFEEFGPVAMIRMRFGPSPKQQQTKKKDEQEEEEHQDKDDSPSSRPHQRVQYRYPAQYAFVEYETTADCEKALAKVVTAKQGNEVEPKRKLQLGGNDLKVTSLQDYMDEQKMKRQAKKEDKKSTATGAQDEKQPADEDGGTENNNMSESPSYTVDWKPGCVIKLEGLADGCDREAIMMAVAKAMDYSTVEALKDDKLVYVDYSRGQTTGAIRFFEPNDKIKTLLSKLWQECPSTTTTTTPATAAATEKVEGGDEGGDKDAKDDTATDKKDGGGDVVIEIAGAKVEKAYLLEGEQEEKYWKEFIDFKNHQKKRQAESSDNRHHQNNNNNRGKHHHRNPKRQKRRHS